MIADTAPRATATPRRLPRLMGWALAALVSAGLWSGLVALARLAL
jgi:hypothetical protein